MRSWGELKLVVEREQRDSVQQETLATKRGATFPPRKGRHLGNPSRVVLEVMKSSVEREQRDSAQWETIATKGGREFYDEREPTLQFPVSSWGRWNKREWRDGVCWLTTTLPEEGRETLETPTSVLAGVKGQP